MAQERTAPTAVGETGSTPVGRRLTLAVSGLLLGMLLASLDQTVVATALWTIVRDLDPAHGLSRLSWVVTVYVLAATATTPLYGRISDLVGRRPLYAIGVGFFLLGSAFAAVAQSLEQLIAARVVQGIGAGGLIGLTFAVVADLAPGRSRGRYQGYFGAVFAVGSIAGPLLGGFVAQQSGWPDGFAAWRWIFLANVPLGLVGLALVLPGVPRRTGPPAPVRVDVPGALLLVTGVCAALLVAEWGGRRYPWSSPPVLALAGTAVLLLVAFLLWEVRLGRARPGTGRWVAAPLVPLRMFAEPVLRTAVPVAAAVGAITFGAIIYLSLYLQITRGLGPAAAGLHLVPMMVGVLLGSTGSGAVISRVGRYEFFPALGTGLAALGLLLLARLGVASSPLALGVDIFLLGLGLGLVTQVVVLAVQNAVSRPQLGAATGTVTFFRQLGGSFGAAVFGAILTAGLAAGAAGADVVGDPARLRTVAPAEARAAVTAFVDALHVVFLSAAAIMVVAFLLSLRLLVVLRRAGAAPAAG